MSSSQNPVRRILVGFDGSPGAEDAIELARVLRTPDSELLLVNVLPPIGPMQTSFFALGKTDAPEAKELFRDARDALGGSGVRDRTYYGGSPAHVLTQIAEEKEFDLIVVGSPHRGAVGRALLGSVARGLMHGAPVPATTAPRGYAARAHNPIGAIAVSYDGMPESAAALGEAEALARAWGAPLKVLTVTSLQTTVAGMLGYVPPMPKPPEQVLADGVASVASDIPVEGRELEGRSIALAVAAACDDVDLLVCGSRGYGPFSRVMIGSVSTALIEAAPCPVMIVPRPAHGGA